MPLATVTVSGTLLDAAQNPIHGNVTFTPASGVTDAAGNPVITSITDAGGNIVIAMSGVPEALDASGQFRAALIPTDTPGLAPMGWDYQVTISIPGTPDYGFSCLIPASPLAFTATSAAPAVFTAPGSAYTAGAAVTLSGASLPGGFTAGTTYYVTAPSGASFSLAATSGGAAVTSTTAGSGTVSTAVTDLSQLVPVTPVTSTPQPWNLTTAAGSDQRWNFTLTIPGTSTPLPISGATWEYVVRPTATSAGAPLAAVTTTASAAGLITVTATSSLSRLLLDIYPAATAALTPGIFFHALWLNPGTSSARVIVSGSLVVQGTPQP